MRGASLAHLLRYHDELRDVKDAGGTRIEEAAAGRSAAAPQELAMAEQLMSAMVMKWDPTGYTDTYRRDVLRLVEDLSKGRRPMKVKARAPEDGKVIDLVLGLDPVPGGAGSLV
ncbi:MAG TPA: hypothetical protein VFN96_01105 [Gemmatimonadales bacterium]|nr:hypothetical protein [Gemmatimonadales bacterium]